MKNFLLLIFTAVCLASCSSQDEPEPEIFSQVSEITNSSNSISKTITYDAYGRAIKYTALFSPESITATYTYPSDNLIIIHTQDVIFGQNGASDILRTYEEELHLENGRASYCEGILSINDGGSLFQKKYRHDFTYTTDNHLNVIKWTEWNKRGDDWAYDKPWTWENYYVWENGNLTEIEDFSGNKRPYCTYKYIYSSMDDVQNIIPIHYGRFQYYPLQLKGIFGLQPQNPIIGIEQTIDNGTSYKTDYNYNIIDGKIVNYSEIHNDVSDDFTVTWTY